MIELMDYQELLKILYVKKIGNNCVKRNNKKNEVLIILIQIDINAYEVKRE